MSRPELRIDRLIELAQRHLPSRVTNVLMQEVLAQVPQAQLGSDQAIQMRIRDSVLVPALLDVLPLFVTNATELANLRRDITNGNREAIATTYGRAVRWLQEQHALVSGQLVQRLIRSGPGGTPLPVENGFPIIPELQTALIRTGNLALPLSTDTRVIFGANNQTASAEILRFDDAVQWMRNSLILLDRSRQVHDSRSLSRFFALNGFPASYQAPTDAAALETWLPRAQEVSNVYMTVRNYAQIMLSLHGQPGINVSAIDELRALGIDIRYNMGTREFDPNHFRLAAAMPPDLNATVTNEEILAPLRAWLARHRPAILAVVEPMERATREALADRRSREANGEVLPPAPFLRWGHENVAGVRRINGVDHPYDFIDHDFTVSRNGNQISIHRTLTYYRRRTISAHNFFVDPVGPPVTDTITRPANALFPTVGQRDTIGMERMDHLERWRGEQEFWFNVNRWGSIALDVGMVVSGTRGIVLASRAAWMGNATRLAATRAIAYNLAHVGMGLGGIFEHNLSPALNDVRRAAMAIDIVGGTISGRWRGLSELGHAANRSLLMRIATDPGFLLMEGGGIATLPLIGGEIFHNVSGERRDNRPLFNQALGLFDLIQAPEGPNIEGARRPLFDFSNQTIRDGVLAILTDNARTLFAGVPRGELPADVRAILDETTRLVGRPHTDNEVRAFISRLVRDHFSANGTQLARLHETLRERNLTPEQIRQECLRVSGNPNRTKIIAAAAMLLLSLDGNGRLPSTIGSTNITVAPWRFNVSGGQGGGATVEQQGREVVNFQLQTADLMAILRRRAVGTSASAEQLIAAETLWHYCYQDGNRWRQGLSDTQLAGVYLNAIGSNNNTLQRRALMGAPNGISLGVLLHNLQLQEAVVPANQRDPFVAQRYGLLPQNILAVLSQRAGTIQNPDIRAALLGIHGALNPGMGNTRRDLVAAIPGLLRQHEANNGAFANAFFSLIERDQRRPTIAVPPMIGLGGGLFRDASQTALFANQGLGDVAARDTSERRIRNAQILLAAGRLTPQQFNAELLGMLGNSDNALNVIIVGQLKYDVLSTTQRQRVLALLDGSSTNGQNFLLKLTVLERLPQLLLLTPEARVVDGVQGAALTPLRARAVLCLQRMLTPGHNLFAGEFETVRIAAIAALANFGQGNDTATINSLVGRINGTPGDPVPAVRYAAVLALNRLNPPNLSALLTTLIGRETDPATAALARDIRSEIGMQAQPDRATLQDHRQAILALILRGGDLRTQVGREYILAHHPLLFDESRRPRFNRTHWARFGEDFNIGWRWDVRAFERELEETFNPNGRNSLWVAARNGEPRAIAGLAHIIESHGNDIPERAARPDFVEYSALLLAGLCVPDSPHRELARDWVVYLLRNSQLGPREERRLLQAVRILNRPNQQGNRAISNVEAARIFAAVLSKRFLDQTRVPQGHADYEGHVRNQFDIIRDLRTLRCRDASVIGLLQALSDERGHIDPSLTDAVNRSRGRNVDSRVGRAAGEAAGYLLDGVIASALFIFSENRPGDTRPLAEQRTPRRPGDPLATGAQRAGWITHALEHRNENTPGNINDEATIRAMFRAIHGLGVVPRTHEVVTTLLGIMNAQPANERLQLAAAYALTRLNIQNASSIYSGAAMVLASLAANGRLPAYRREAREILEGLDGPNPRATWLVDVATYILRAERGRSGIEWLMLRVGLDLENRPPGPVNPEREAAAIGRALRPLQIAGEDPVETIARACLGKPFLPSDPRLAQLASALGHQNERIRFIAAVMLVRMGPDSLRGRALEAIGSLVAGGSNEHIRREAFNILHRSTLVSLRDGFIRMSLPNNRTIDQYWGGPEGPHIVDTQGGLVRNVVLPDGSVRSFYWNGSRNNARLIGYSSNGIDYRILRREGNRNVWSYRSILGGEQTVTTIGDTVAPNGDYTWTDVDGIVHVLKADGSYSERHPNGRRAEIRDGRFTSLSVVLPTDRSQHAVRYEYTRGSLTRVNMPGGVSFRREGNSNNWRLFNGENASSEIWQSDGQLTLEGVCSFTRTVQRNNVSTTYTRRTDGSSTISDSLGRSVDAQGDHATSIVYSSGDIYRRMFSYENGQRVRMDVIFRPAGRPMESFVRERGTNNWVLQQGTRSRTFSGTMQATRSGDYGWSGADGYWEHQALTDSSVNRGRGAAPDG